MLKLTGVAVVAGGGYRSDFTPVVPGDAYTITVGVGGSKKEGYYGEGGAQNGASGFVLIAYGGDI